MMLTTVLALLIAALPASLLTPPQPLWQWPVSGDPWILRDFDAPESPWGPGHRGLDLAGKVGGVVRSPVAGVVSFSGNVATRGVITIRTAEGHLVSMEPVHSPIESGHVRAGEKLATLASGHCPGGCLHIGLRVEGEYRSPARELGVLRRAVLGLWPD